MPCVTDGTRPARATPLRAAVTEDLRAFLRRCPVNGTPFARVRRTRVRPARRAGLAQRPRAGRSGARADGAGGADGHVDDRSGPRPGRCGADAMPMAMPAGVVRRRCRGARIFTPPRAGLHEFFAHSIAPYHPIFERLLYGYTGAHCRGNSLLRFRGIPVS